MVPRSAFPILFSLLLILSGCLGPERKAEIGTLTKKVSLLQTQLVEAQASGSPEVETIRLAIEKATQELQAAKHAALQDRVGTGAGYVEQVAQSLQPIAMILLPFLAPILGLVATAAGAVRGSVGKKG